MAFTENTEFLLTCHWGSRANHMPQLCPVVPATTWVPQ